MKRFMKDSDRRNYGLAWNKIGDAIDLLEEVSPKPTELIDKLEKIAKEIYERKENMQKQEENLEESLER